MKCSSPDVLAALTEGRLEGADREAALDHAADCDDCRQALLLLELQQGQESRSPATARTQIRARSAVPSRIPWMVAAALALSIGGLLILSSNADRRTREAAEARNLRATQEPWADVPGELPDETRPVPAPPKQERPEKRPELPPREGPRLKSPQAPVELPPPAPTPTPEPPALQPPAPIKPTPAADPVKPETVTTVALLDRVDGDVFVWNGSGRTAAKAGHAILAGEGLECSGVRSSVVVSYPDRTRLELSGDTMVREFSERTPVAPRRLVLQKGSIRADVAKQPEPMLFSTPHGDARVLGTVLRLRVEADPKKGTHLEVEEGKVELRNAAGKAVLVEAGHQAVAASGAALSAKPLPREENIFAFDFEDAKKPALVEVGTLDRGPGGRICLAGDPEPSGACRIMVSDGAAGLFTFQGDEVLSFDYWADPQCSAVNFNLWNRTLGKNCEGAVSKVSIGRWVHATFRVSDLGDAATRIREGDWITGLYLQGTGPGPRKFYVDNLQITRQRVLKPKSAEIKK